MSPLSEDPQADPIRKPGARKQAATWLTPEQVEQIRDACLTDAFPNYLQGRNETIITLFADTGLRVSELVALDWDHLDLDADPAEVYLPGAIQKGTKRDAYLDLENETARQFRRYRNGAWKTTAAVFPSRQSDRVSKTSVRRLVKKAAEVADVRPFVAGAGRGEPSDVSPHTFRHSIAFRMIRREDKRLEDVMLRLRHSSIQTTDQIYGHLRRR
ncbi:tyrosine-type recombinase/integrase [Halalkalicoccus salilacus]|uniref:tyrosine-type recombinase/integrase n=1 Tax=Halalkalicoccus salilacus TaxID=3117459 RepID=UPI00300E9C1C